MSKQSKIPPEEKIRLVRQCLAKEIGVTEAAKIAGVDATAVCEWVRLYEAEGVEGLIPQERNRVYTTETKLQAVLDYLAGKGSYREISKKYKLRSTNQLRRWIKVYKLRFIC